MTFVDLEHYISATLSIFLDNAVLVAAGALALWLATTLALTLVKHKDQRIGFLADFLGVDPEEIIPLPPSTALWNDYYRTNRDATADSHFPPGGPSLQGAYLIHAEGGMTLVAIHNLETINLYRDPEEPELLDYIEPSIGTHGRIDLQRIPVDIDEDAARRANIVEFLLKAKFGYPGKVRVIILLRDKNNIAPEPDVILTRSGETIHRLTFENKDAAHDALVFEDTPVKARNLDQIRNWFLSYPGRQTSKLRLATRSGLLAICLALLAFGHRGITVDTIDSITRSLLH
jgi:hypothetical protein